VQIDVGSRASIALLVFFIGYTLLKIPSNIILRKVGAANWLSFIVFAWGMVAIGLGFSQSWITVAVCRAILGALEAGLFPGSIYMISTWYKRQEVQSASQPSFLTLRLFKLLEIS